MKAGVDTLNMSSDKLFSQGFKLLATSDSRKCQISMFSFDFNTSSMMKIEIFIVIVWHGSVVVWLRCSGYIVHQQIRRSVRIKQLQEFLKSDHWWRRYCILSVGIFYFEPPCRHPQNLGCRRQCTSSSGVDIFPHFCCFSESYLCYRRS